MRFTRTLRITVIIAALSIALTGCDAHVPWSHHASATSQPSTDHSITIDIPKDDINGSLATVSTPADYQIYALHGQPATSLQITVVNHQIDPVVLGLVSESYDPVKNVMHITNLHQGMKVGRNKCFLEIAPCGTPRKVSGYFPLTDSASSNQYYFLTINGQPTRFWIGVWPNGMPQG